ncbi:hypothetical protein [Cohnella sp. AR92]|uniref:hypothetical protein n=1 Tax=Cohnella sp. AR92 TaxID=648716 RepID=UPI000F8D290F|nr:hypothetical protein [Cohnella sp. AR92]RUS45725.1 hypothetical protein ELR57_17845 [Cohnella sp. AR92]
MTPASNGAEDIFGPNASSVMTLTRRLEEIPWYSAAWDPSARRQAEHDVLAFAKQFGLQDFAFHWLTREELNGFIARLDLTDDSLWHHLFHLPEQVKTRAEQTNRTAYVTAAADLVPERIFHAAFDGAFSAFKDEGNALSYAVGTALFVGGVATGWEIVADESADPNPLLALLPVLELGYWPIGLFDNKFYLI